MNELDNLVNISYFCSTNIIMKIPLVALLMSLVISCHSSQKKTTNTDTAIDTSKDSNHPASVVSIYLVEQMRMPSGEMLNVRDQDITMEVQGQGIIIGNSSCNGFQGKYQYTDGFMTTSEMLSTQMSCGSEKDKIERAFFETLSQKLMARSAIRGLEFWDSTGTKVLLNLKKIDE